MDTMSYPSFCTAYAGDPSGYVASRALMEWRTQCWRATRMLGEVPTIPSRPDEWPYPHPKTVREQMQWLTEDMAVLRAGLTISWDQVKALAKTLWRQVRKQHLWDYA